jgi:hypothetical protein
MLSRFQERRKVKWFRGLKYLTKAPGIKKAIPTGMAFYYV